MLRSDEKRQGKKVRRLRGFSQIRDGKRRGKRRMEAGAGRPINERRGANRFALTKNDKGKRSADYAGFRRLEMKKEGINMEKD